MNKKYIVFILICITICLAFYCFFTLPETVVVQIDFSGNASNSFPKLVAIGLPSLLAIGSSIIYGHTNQDESKYLVISIVGIACLIVTLFFNR